jgi:hypothetical protein
MESVERDTAVEPVWDVFLRMHICRYVHTCYCLCFVLYINKINVGSPGFREPLLWRLALCTGVGATNDFLHFRLDNFLLKSSENCSLDFLLRNLPETPFFPSSSRGLCEERLQLRSEYKLWENRLPWPGADPTTGEAILNITPGPQGWTLPLGVNFVP